MRNSRAALVPRLASLLLLLFIAGISVASARHTDDNALLHPGSPKVDARILIQDNPSGYIAGRWKNTASEARPLKIEIDVFKGQVPKGPWAFSQGYKYSSRNYNSPEMESVDGRGYGKELHTVEKTRGRTEIASNDKVIFPSDDLPMIDSRNIIDAPGGDCPPGQAKDPKGVCREIIEM